MCGKAHNQFGIKTDDFAVADKYGRLGAGFHAHANGFSLCGDVELGHGGSLETVNPVVADGFQLAAFSQAFQELIELTVQFLLLFVEDDGHVVLRYRAVLQDGDVVKLAGKGIADNVVHDGGITALVLQCLHHVCFQIIALEFQIRVVLLDVDVLNGGTGYGKLFALQVINGGDSLALCRCAAYPCQQHQKCYQNCNNVNALFHHLSHPGWTRPARALYHLIFSMQA